MRIFDLKGHGTTVGRECVAGATTFLTMAYIIFVNPAILSAAGMDKGALITVTVMATVFGTLLVGLWANVPFAMAPGMGLNAFFTYTLVLGEGVSWQTALGLVFLSGVFFLLLTLIGVREKVVAAIPLSLRLAVAAGIGLFIAFIGLQNMGLVARSEATLVQLGNLDTQALLGLGGLFLVAILEVRRIPGAILIGIGAATLAGLLTGVAGLPDSWVSLPPSPAPIIFKLDIIAALSLSMLGAIFSFMFVDLFDSVGTIVACAHQAGMVGKNGGIPKIGRILEADAIATVAGSLFGTSTTTTYIESGSGIAAGGRTGLTAVVVAGLFGLALLFTGVIGMVPAFASAPALVVVGVYMFRSIRDIDFTDFGVAIPCFLTIVLMPLTYSISVGLIFGFLSYIAIAVTCGRARTIKPVLWGIGVLSLLELMLKTGLF